MAFQEAGIHSIDAEHDDLFATRLRAMACAYPGECEEQKTRGFSAMHQAYPPELLQRGQLLTHLGDYISVFRGRRDSQECLKATPRPGTIARHFVNQAEIQLC